VTTVPPEPWLRGSLPGIPAALQPVGHALIAAREDVEGSLADLTPAQCWLRPGGAASIGFHLLHLAGSTDRLFSYARGEALSDLQRAALAAEQTLVPPYPAVPTLLLAWRQRVEQALGQLGQTPEALLREPRLVGRARLPSTVQGLLFHAAEHAQRHTGQIISTAKIIRGLGL
jgi:uncharacterized damage-inducible protein DinB